MNFFGLYRVSWTFLSIFSFSTCFVVMVEVNTLILDMNPCKINKHTKQKNLEQNENESLKIHVESKNQINL